MSDQNVFHLSTSAAETYEAQRVPAIFGPMAEATLEAIELPACREVLDVACGTGAMARAVAARLSRPCHVTGCDLNPAMIEVAKASTPDGLHTFDWIAAPADASRSTPPALTSRSVSTACSSFRTRPPR